jgi:hypothetical protein
MIDFTAQQSRDYSETLERSYISREVENRVIAEFNREMLKALMNSPESLMRYGEGGRKLAPAHEFFSDFLGKAEVLCLLRILSDAASGLDVGDRAAELIGQCAKEYAEYHGADAAEAE